MRVITVVLNADQSHEDDLAIFKTTNQLLQYLLINFQKVQLIENNKPVKTLSVLDSSEKTVKLVAQNSLFFIKPIHTKTKNTVHITKKSSTMIAPLSKGQVLGRATLQDKHLIGQGYLDTPPSINLILQKNISKSFFLKVWWNRFVRYVNTSL